MCFQTSPYEDIEKGQAGSKIFTEAQFRIIKILLENATVGERVLPAGRAYNNAIIVRQDGTGIRRE